jgi:hypothetical protein
MGALDIYQECRRNSNIQSFPFLLLLECVFNLFVSLCSNHFTAMTYLKRFRTVKRFIEKTAMMGNVMVPQSMECVPRMPSAKDVENR